MQTTKIS